MAGKSIDEYMAEDSGYWEEIERIVKETEERKEAAKTDEELKNVRCEAIARFQQADLARYDRAKKKAYEDAGR